MMEKAIVPLWRSRRLLLVVAGVVLVAGVAVIVGVKQQDAHRADSRKDEQVKVGLTAIRKAVYAYSLGHKHFVPSPGEVDVVGLKGYLPAGTAWPDNPFTGQPMEAGAAPGDFQYKCLGPLPTTGYTLDGVGADGKSVW
jgi:hypothetical protein